MVLSKKYNLRRIELAAKSDVNEKYIGKIEMGYCSASLFIIRKTPLGLNKNLLELFK